MPNTLFHYTAAFMFLAVAGCAQPDGGPVTIPTTSVKNLKQDGAVFVAGAPTPEGLDEMKDRGVTTIIDLRRPEEAAYDEEAAARARGLNYIRLPMPSDQLTPQQADAFIDALRPHEHEKVLIHCAGGSRAAAMYGLYLGTEKSCPTAEALRRARQAGLKNEKLTEDLTREVDRRRTAGE
ncbi:MAG TPA: sulfur transferase domain-containing protein [Phycisphaerae bacterium]|nr:sulfur transferase domain-containing protein [Phycisphaerae bacterium]